MGRHSSLQIKSTGGSSKRTVLKRFERVDILKAKGQWKDGDRVMGLRKTNALV
jgi:small basic protein (TIGR04137 family)